MLSSPLSDLHKPEPLRDDLFGHGHGFGDERPPDVDKMWKDFNRRLNRLFRLKKKKDDEPERSDRDDDPFNDREARPRALKIMACVILLIATVFWLGTGVYSVEEGQTGVVMTFAGSAILPHRGSTGGCHGRYRATRWSMFHKSERWKSGIAIR